MISFYQHIVIVIITGVFTLLGVYFARRGDLESKVMATLPERRIEAIWSFIVCTNSMHKLICKLLIAFHYNKPKEEIEVLLDKVSQHYTELERSSYIIKIYINKKQYFAIESFIEFMEKITSDIACAVEGNATHLEVNHCMDVMDKHKDAILNFLTPMVFPKKLKKSVDKL